MRPGGEHPEQIEPVYHRASTLRCAAMRPGGEHPEQGSHEMGSLSCGHEDHRERWRLKIHN